MPTAGKSGDKTEPLTDARGYYRVSRAELPLHCPLPGTSLWNSHPRVFLPIVWVLQHSSNASLRLMRVKPAPAGMIAFTREDIRQSVAAAEDSGEIETAEEEMLYKVFDFAEKEAADVLLREVVVVGDKDRARLGVEAVGERLTQGQDAPAGPQARLQNGHVVARAAQFVSGG